MGPDRSLRLFIYARIVVTFLFLASTILVNYQDPVSADELFHSGIVMLMAFSFLFSCVSHLALSIRKFRNTTIYLQSIWDVLFVTLLLLFTGGISSPYSFLYLLSIMNAGVLLGRRDALYTASLCGILYGAMVDFQFFGLLESIGLSQIDARQLGTSHLFYSIFLNLMAFGLCAFITGFLAEQARKSEEALREKIINYEELSQLNTKIVSNIDTGLMTTNLLGNIRVFNPFAENLTGLTQMEVYDKPISSLFPELSLLTDSLTDTIRGDFEYVNRDGLHMIFGFSASPFDDNQKESASVIVNFRDVTDIRRMENALKRADRLSAIGELSARMAHEIRNPLAAIRGSVQMLAEKAVPVNNNGRLLAIVVRESDRLNKLISDFLTYARPSSPHKVAVDLKTLIDDMRLLLLADIRFNNIEISNRVPSHILILADFHQISQVLMNLLHNSADAMPDGGSIEIDAHFLLRGADGLNKSPVVRISVTDTGKGIDPEKSQHLFEPFWTTKTEGTGLGLAIIYRIIEAHGGTITVESPSAGGCCFTILLPV
ncbi:MAG: PAS domain S-box protein [Desulfuromonadales bacterium]|nr:PAS domain S-box protein [Desulfuromonadales bacterium]